MKIVLLIGSFFSSSNWFFLIFLGLTPVAAGCHCHSLGLFSGFLRRRAARPSTGIFLIYKKKIPSFFMLKFFFFFFFFLRLVDFFFFFFFVWQTTTTT